MSLAETLDPVEKVLMAWIVQSDTKRLNKAIANHEDDKVLNGIKKEIEDADFEAKRLGVWVKYGGPAAAATTAYLIGSAVGLW